MGCQLYRNEVAADRAYSAHRQPRNTSRLVAIPANARGREVTKSRIDFPVMNQCDESSGSIPTRLPPHLSAHCHITSPNALPFLDGGYGRIGTMA